jgi:hypothetical protein
VSVSAPWWSPERSRAAKASLIRRTVITHVTGTQFSADEMHLLVELAQEAGIADSLADTDQSAAPGRCKNAAA